MKLSVVFLAIVLLCSITLSGQQKAYTVLNDYSLRPRSPQSYLRRSDFWTYPNYRSWQQAGANFYCGYFSYYSNFLYGGSYRYSGTNRNYVVQQGEIRGAKRTPPYGSKKINKSKPCVESRE